jgi:protein O-GlcNAc transferase
MLTHYQRAQQAHQKGDLATAEQYYIQTLQQSPRFAEAYHYLGLVRSQQGRKAEGIADLQQAIRLNPIQPNYYNNLGLMFAQSAEWANALQCYQMATKLAPKFAEAWCNAALAHKNLQQTEQAIRLYEKTLKIQSNHVRAAYNLGNLLLETGKPKSARTWLERAIAIQPQHVEAHNNLGTALDAWGEYELAFQHFQKAVDLNPNFTDALANLGNACLKRGDYPRARTLLYESLVRKQSTGWETLILESLSPVIFDDNAHIDAFLQQLTHTLQAYATKRLPIDLAKLHEMRLEPATGLPYLGRNLLSIQQLYAQVFRNGNFGMGNEDFGMRNGDFSMQDGDGDWGLQDENADWGAQPSQSTPFHTSNSPFRTRIGFVVTHGHEGVFLKCMRGIINHFDTLHFDVTIVCNLPHGAAKLKEGITNPAIQYLEIPAPMDKAIEKIKTAQFDILHYWEVGTDAQNYFLPHFRLARVQCATWGWPVTTGTPNVDYFVSSEGLETQDSDAHYTEKLICLKRLPTYYYHPPVPPVLKGREAFGLPKTGNLYLICQNLRKVHPDLDEILYAVLEKDAAGYIVFIADAHPPITELLRKRLERRLGAHSPRLYIVERMDERLYLNLLAIADVILDTLYYTGGANTSYDAFAVGTPYVTLPTEYHRGRYGAAAYQQIGITDAIACNPKDYVEKAVRIAQDKIYRQQLSNRIREQAHLVFEDMEAVHELESFFKQALTQV